MSDHDERTLPKWAQERLREQREAMASMGEFIVRQGQACAIVLGREWFAIPGPHTDDNREVYRLWSLNNEHPHPVCSLYRDDLLLVGRAIKRGYGPTQKGKSLLPDHAQEIAI